MTAFVRLLLVGLAALSLSGAAEAARVPGRVTSIRIRSATGVTARVTRPATVRQIVKWFNTLPRFVARPCPYPVHQPPDVTFDFRHAGGVVLHAVDHLPGACSGEITYGNDGQVGYAPLADGNFVARVSKLIGVDIDRSATTAGNKRLAKRDAAHLLELVVRPPGSRRVAKPPNALLAHAASIPGTPTLVDLHRIWKVRMSGDAVVAFERAHRPHGSRIGETGSGDQSQQIAFSFPALGRRVSSRELVLNIVPLASGWTGIRIDAQDVWVVARSRGEVVPGGVTMIDIRKGSLLVHRVSAPWKVARIIRWFDALPLSPPGVYHCPAMTARLRERILFRGGPEMQVLARASAMPFGAASGPCNPIAFGVDGHSFPALDGGRFLIRVEKLLR
jgi:hypothetical protein